MLGPMKLMMASEFASTEDPETSLFQRLSLTNGGKQLRLAPCPVLIALQALCLLLPEPAPLPDPLPPLPGPPPPGDNVEAPAPPPQPPHKRASASKPDTASKFCPQNSIDSIFIGNGSETNASQVMSGKNRDMYYQHLAEGRDFLRVIMIDGNGR